MLLCPAIQLPDQPCASEQRIACDNAQPAQQRVRRQPVEPAPGIGPVDHFDTLQQRAERHALRHRGHQRSAEERCVPERPVCRIAPAVLEGDPAKHEAEQHGDDKRIGRRQHDRISQREGREEAAPAEHQPGLVTIPHRSDGVHRPVPALPDLKGREQDADAEVETVHDNIGEDGEGDDESPDDGQVHHTSSLSAGSGSSWPGFWVGPGVIPAVRIGPVSPRLTPASPTCGTLPIRRRMYQTPTPKTAK